MKPKLTLIALLLFCRAVAQDKPLYDPKADAAADIAAAVEKAGRENKFVLIQGGGNWCKWCIEFARFCRADQQIDSLIKRHFIWYHLNSSRENQNREIFARYGYPQRFGFPVFIILNGRGERIHTQNSEYLEDGKTYSRDKVLAFLDMWTPVALDPAKYQQ